MWDPLWGPTFGRNKVDMEVPMSKQTLARRQKQDYAAYLFIAPFVILALVFMVYPIYRGFITSFYNTKWAKEVFVGFDNYKKIFR